MFSSYSMHISPSHRKISKLLKKKHLFLLLILFLLDIFLAGVFIVSKNVSGVLLESSLQYPEIAELAKKELPFPELKIYFQRLAEAKSPEYAYDVLKVAPIPVGTDIHLLGHVVGDVLYKKRGALGITVCTQDFRNACSHSIVVGLLLDKGEGAIEEISQACKKAPGGAGAYTMCYHGLGHGILAYTAYDLPKATGLCEKTGKADGGREFPECTGGMVMEIITGGDHDKALWAKQRTKYLTKDDPLSPCNKEYMSDPAARYMCYTYLTPNLFVSAGGDLGDPKPADFEKAFAYCEEIPRQKKQDRQACFGGFGKEFIVLAKGRDIRNMGEMTMGQLNTVYDWCLLGKSKEAMAFCINSAVASLFWGGENKPDAAINLCSITVEESLKNDCFKNFFSEVSNYVKDRHAKKIICDGVPKNFQELCRLKS